jgi:hypothetical protein
MERIKKTVVAISGASDKPSVVVHAVPSVDPVSVKESSPTAKVWSKYVDSRLKQFGSR